MAARGDVERLAHREQADRQRRHLDAVEQFGDAEGKRGLAGQLVDADRPSVSPMNRLVSPRIGELPKVADTVTKATHINAK